MRNYMAILAGGLLMSAAATASAQTQLMAYSAPAPKGEMVVFAEKGGQPLSPTAMSTVRRAAGEANATGQVTLVGRAENVASVKDALMQQGVPAEAIKERHEARAPIAKAADGLSDPIDRRVEIKY
jgi:hypothetical protein